MISALIVAVVAFLIGITILSLARKNRERRSNVGTETEANKYSVPREGIKSLSPDIKHKTVSFSDREKLQCNVGKEEVNEALTIEESFSGARGKLDATTSVNDSLDQSDLLSSEGMFREQLVSDSTATLTANYINSILKTGVDEVPISELLIFVGSRNASFNRNLSVELAATLESLGFGSAPDPRKHGIKPQTSGSVKVFSLSGFPSTIESDRFFYLVVMVHLTSMVSKADKLVLESEKQLASFIISSSESVSGYERKSLNAFFDWCFSNSHGYRGIERIIKKLDNSERLSIWRHLVNVAIVDKQLDVRELAELQKIYDVLELDSLKKHVYLAAVSNAILTAERQLKSMSELQALERIEPGLKQDPLVTAEFDFEMENEVLDTRTGIGRHAWAGRFHSVNGTIQTLNEEEYFDDTDWFNSEIDEYIDNG